MPGVETRAGNYNAHHASCATLSVDYFNNISTFMGLSKILFSFSQEIPESSSTAIKKSSKVDMNVMEEKKSMLDTKADKLKPNAGIPEQLISEDGLEPGEVLTDVSDAFSDTRCTFIKRE